MSVVDSARSYRLTFMLPPVMYPRGSGSRSLFTPGAVMAEHYWPTFEFVLEAYDGKDAVQRLELRLARDGYLMGSLWFDGPGKPGKPDEPPVYRLLDVAPAVVVAYLRPVLMQPAETPVQWGPGAREYAGISQ